MRKILMPLALMLVSSHILWGQDIPEQHNEAGTRDLKSMQGNWIIQKVVRSGQRLNTDTGEKSVNRFAVDKWYPGRNPDDYSRLTLNGETTPKQIDIVSLDGAKMLGLYRLENDDLTFVFAKPGEPRPTKLVSDVGSPTYLMEFRRETKAKR